MTTQTETSQGSVCVDPDARWVGAPAAISDAEGQLQRNFAILGVVLAATCPLFMDAYFLNLMIQIAYERAPYLALERPDLPAALSNAVDRALEPKPADRWSTAAAMAAALRG